VTIQVSICQEVAVSDDPKPPPIGWTSDDAVMADLRTWLVGQGFIVLSDRYDAESFGNQEVTLTRPIAVRLVRDRGQWWVDVLGADGQWTGVQRWREALRGNGRQLMSAAEQADTLREILSEIEQRPR
jgi:hypothetical protein